ncbi:splicing factor 3B subunit 1-like, partial [Dorcoceras hygrometricum]
KYVEISASRLAGVFNLPTDGLIDLSEVPNDLVLQARTLFTHSGKPVQFSCKKRLLKYEFRLLNDILAKSITVKAGYFDALTQERFLMMTAIHFGIKVNWNKILFEVLKEMVDKTTRRAKGFAAQICVLLKGDPVVTLGEAKTFPPLKILSEKTVNTYVATNKTIDARGATDEPDVATVAFVKKKSVSKKRPASMSEALVFKKKRTSSGKDVSKEKDLAIVSVALDAEPIQTVDPTSAIPAAHPHAPKRRAPKRKLRTTASFDDVDKIIDTVITETAQMETDMEEPSLTRSDDIAFEVTEGSSAVNDEDDNLDGAENEISRKMASFTASKQLPQEPSRSVLSKLADLELVKGIIAKEKQLLAWAETDSLETAVRRREFTIAKYREMLLRKFLESHRQHFQAGQPSTTTDLKIIAFLSNAHIFAVETLQTHMRIHGLKWERICSSRLFEGENRDRGAVIARSNTSTRSLCWLRTKTMVDGYWVIQEANDLWQRLPKQTVPLTFVLSPQRQLDDTLALFSSHHPDPAVFASISQRPLDTDLTSPNPSTMDSRIFFTTDDTPMGVAQILMPTAVSPQVFTEPLAQLRALVNLISNERVHVRNDSEKLKDMLLMEIRSLEKKVTEMLVQQDSLYRGLDDIRKDVDETKAALSNAILEFQAQENYDNLSSQLGELVAYINRGGNDKKGEGGSSRPQPPPDYQNRPSGGSASRGGGGSGGSSRRDDRRDSFKKRRSSSGGGGSGTGGESYGPYGLFKKDAEYWLFGKNQF